MTQDFKDWVRKVRIAMIDANLNQAQLATKINVSPAAVSDLLKYGKGSNKIIERINGCLSIK